MQLQPAENYSAASVNPYAFDDPERTRIAYREALDVLLFKARSGRVHSGLIFNRDFLESSDLVIVADGQFLGATPLPEDKYKGFQLAAANPETPIMLRDFGGHGLSDRHSLAQLKDAIKHKRLDSDADDWAGITVDYAPHASRQRLMAISLSALLAPRYAKKSQLLGLATDHIVGIEAVGTDEKSTTRLLFDFFGSETYLQKIYKGKRAIGHKALNSAYETDFKDALEQARVAEGLDPETYKLYSIYRHDPAIIGAMLLRSPLATSQFFPAMHAALAAQPDMQATFCLAGRSRVNRLKQVEPGYEKLKSDFPDQFRYQVWPKDSHGLGLAPQTPRLVKFFQDAVSL